MAKLMEVVVRGLYFDQEVINRFNYLSPTATTTVPYSLGLTEGFGGVLDDGEPVSGTLLWQWAQMVADSFTFVDMFVRDVYSDIDFLETALGNAGKRTEQGNSPALAFGFKTNRTNLSIHRGQKRLCGVSEGMSDPGGVLSPGAATLAASMANKLTATLPATSGTPAATFAPVIVSKEKYNIDTGLADPDGTAYRYYSDLAAQTPHIATNIVWTHYTDVTTQNSRKKGRGR